MTSLLPAFWARQAVASRADPSLDPNVTQYTSPWMDDFVLLVLDQMKDKGYDTDQLIDFLGESIVQRFSNADVNPYRGAPYHLPVVVDDGNGGETVLTTWQEINDAYVDDAGPTDFPNENHYPYQYTEGDYPYSYNFIARAALGQVLHLNGAQAAYDWLDNEIESKDRLNEDPTWAFLVSVASIFGDFDDNGLVDGDDIDALAAACKGRFDRSGFRSGRRWIRDVRCQWFGRRKRFRFSCPDSPGHGIRRCQPGRKGRYLGPRPLGTGVPRPEQRLAVRGFYRFGRTYQHFGPGYSGSVLRFHGQRFDHP